MSAPKSPTSGQSASASSSATVPLTEAPMTPPDLAATSGEDVDEKWLDELFQDSEDDGSNQPPIAVNVAPMVHNYSPHQSTPPYSVSPSASVDKPAGDSTPLPPDNNALPSPCDSSDSPNHGPEPSSLPTKESDENCLLSSSTVRPKKRKHVAHGSDEESSAEENPPAKKKARDDAGRNLDRLADAEQKKLASAPNKHITAMKKRHFLPIPKHIANTAERREEVKKDAQKHVKHVAPMLAERDMNRDLDGKKNKFDLQKARQDVQPAEWTGKRWTDEEDPGVTWIIVPATQTYVTTGKKMVPVQDIITKSIKFPEFTYVEDIEGPHSKTGKMIVKAYKIKYEKLDDEQATERMAIMIKQAKAEARQAKKDATARQKANGTRTGKSATERRDAKGRTRAAKAAKAS